MGGGATSVAIATTTVIVWCDTCELPAATPENGLSPRRQAGGTGARELLAVVGAA